MKAFLEVFLKRYPPAIAKYKVIDHNSKAQLLRELPKRLLAYAKYASIPLVLVLVDRDDGDCTLLKGKLEAAAKQAGFTTKTAPDAQGNFNVANRVVIEELEAWFFGDNAALTQTYPGVTATLHKKRPFRDPDAIKGGTHERLLKVLQAAGHHKGLTSLPKIETARKMGAALDPQQNLSSSFNQFVGALAALGEQAQQVQHG